jgi:RNA polymerase sigma-70 factor (ECF subfamily)
VSEPSDSDAETGPRGSDATEVEQAIRRHASAGELDVAATRALEHYGPELYGFLRAIARDDDLASEAFAQTSEQLWRNLGKFRWEASLRTWAYRIARNALSQLRADPRRRPERNLPISLVASIEEVRRSATAPYQRTEIKDGLRALRDALDPVDHEILILRLDRAMSWKDIARALDDASEDDHELGQRAAALRKRFERAKTQLRELAIERKLLTSD